MSNLGIFVHGVRPQSKKHIKEVIKEGGAAAIKVEQTSMFVTYRPSYPIGIEPLLDMPVGSTITFVGPDPYTSRKFFGNITRTEKGFVVS